MSIPILDQSDYLHDMEELDDLMPAMDPSKGLEGKACSFSDGGYEIVEEPAVDAPAKQALPAPKTIDDFIPRHHIDEALTTASAPAGKLDMRPRPSDDGWGDTPGKASFARADEPVGKANEPARSKTWFGSGGKAPESEDEVKKGLLTRIDAYRSTWPWLDDKITFPPNMHKKSPEKLKAILEECSNKVQNRNMTSMLGIVFSTAICAIENLCTKQFGWSDLKGFALECETDETIKNSIKEIEIKYFASSKAMAPEARLAIALLQKLVAVTNRNRGQRLLEEVARRPLDGSLLAEFEGL